MRVAVLAELLTLPGVSWSSWLSTAGLQQLHCCLDLGLTAASFALVLLSHSLSSPAEQLSRQC